VLADLGADVIKIEAPGAGDYMRNMPPTKAGMSGGYWALNRDKRSVELNLKNAEDCERFLKLSERADVILESFRPGVLDRLGIGYDVLAKRNPSIIVCSISGFGQTGPYAHRAGHDIGYLALSGALALGGEPDGKPALPGVQIADIGGGALWAVSGITAALFARERTGKGEHLDISMTEGALAFAIPHLGFADCGQPVERGKATLNGGLACYNVYETSDGRYLAVGALEPKFWIAFNQAVGRDGNPAELIADAAGQERIRNEVAEILKTRSRDEWMDVFAAVDCCVEPVLELDEVQSHPLHVARNVVRRQPIGEDTDVVAVAMPIGDPALKRPAPRHGEHSAEILGDE